jgi:Holliday junction resolvasome RuvABC endonuclease subunit
MRLIGFDASTKNVGWCLMDDRSEVLASGCYSPKGKRAEDRMPLIWSFAVKLLAEHPVDYVAIEEPRGNHRNMNTNIVLGRAYGQVEAAAYQFSLPVIGVHPMQVKKTGVHKKKLRLASQLAGHKAGEDEADAIGVALWAVGEIKEGDKR